ncbi:glycosyltransferase family 4 protein [Clostridium perfringens]|nr:glycosyltransferase family 4 protein [Clostridium perfringens]
MKFLFVGDYKGNSGPLNVNKNIIMNLNKKYMYISSTKKLIKILECILKTLFSKVIIVSGLCGSGKYCTKIAKILNKKVIYLMHGCVEYESKINQFTGLEEAINLEHYMLDKSDLILAVSSKFKDWLKIQYPQYNNKIDFLNNGIKPVEFDSKISYKKENNIIAIGGNRKIKNNEVVCNAVESLEGVLRFKVFGPVYSNVEVKSYRYTDYLGLIPQEELFNEMKKAKVFILNSVFETFSLAVIDALYCHCSVLVSNVAGVTELLDLKDDDIIFNPMDENEIAIKISKLLKKPNYERILNSIDYENNSYSQAVKKLTSYCENIKKN